MASIINKYNRPKLGPANLSSPAMLLYTIPYYSNVVCCIVTINQICNRYYLVCHSQTLPHTQGLLLAIHRKGSGDSPVKLNSANHHWVGGCQRHVESCHHPLCYGECVFEYI